MADLLGRMIPPHQQCLEFPSRTLIVVRYDLTKDHPDEMRAGELSNRRRTCRTNFLKSHDPISRPNTPCTSPGITSGPKWVRKPVMTGRRRWHSSSRVVVVAPPVVGVADF